MEGVLILASIFAGGLAIFWAGALLFGRALYGLLPRLTKTPRAQSLVAIAGLGLPALFTALLSKSINAPEAALGIAMGSGIIAATFIVGTAALLGAHDSDRALSKCAPLFFPAAIALLYILGKDGILSGFDGVILILAGGAYFFVALRKPGAETGAPPENNARKLSRLRVVLFFVIGLLMLIVGGRMLVWCGVFFCRVRGFSEPAVGMTALALAASVPALYFLVAGSARKEPGPVLTQALGLVAFSLFIIPGLASFSRPLPTSRELMLYDWPMMAGIFMLLFLMLWKQSGRLSRLSGAVLVLAGILFLAVAAIAA